MEGMQMKKVLTAVLLELEKNNVPYALVGALAFAFWGHRRYTEDIDFLVRKDDVDRVKEIMQRFGYNIFIDTQNATQYVHPLKEMLEVDFLYAAKEASLKMIAEARGFVFTEGMSVKVAIPEDLIGLKLQAIMLNPGREPQDLADIAAIVSLMGPQLDWQKIDNYCRILGMEEYSEKIRKYTE
jgi:hypothetical protein